ncbi:MAG: hypothetical protein ACI9W2_003362 [Gammaproteobacteria bacterium]|jgi:hypothetical protein
MYYQVFKLKDGRSNRSLATIETIKVLLADDHLQHFGIFPAYFGLATNELYWVVMREELSLNLSEAIESTGISVVHAYDFVPTVRPTGHQEPTREGLFVFRWFSIENKDVNEIAELSETAWQTFESGFDTEVQGLFAEANRDSNEGTMLLLTWYKGFDVWFDSRTPAAAARENFLKRHALTREAIPIATQRLVI